MPEPTCAECGRVLPAGAPAGMCPNCLMQVGAAAALASGGVRAVPAVSPFQEQPGTRIGRYRLLEPIGEGGFGTVWMAEQEEPVRRKVALKIIKLGMDTKEVVARFEAERQALAMMDHPNIARVFDGGVTENGRPYFVMELVKGVRLTDYCDAQKLGTGERLKLFMEVCEAVQHAHQKGIIHRDLKPSNLLVTVQGDKAVPKVIDFGIAKATGTKLTDKTFFTGFNQVIGTPVYMSPEQAGLGSLDIDTRSDIYALGVILYELLTGRTPFSNEELARAGVDEILRTIREREPPKPSTRLSTLGREELAVAAARRSSPPAKLNRVLRGELDWIVMKCLEKDRARRYGSATDLAAELGRWIEGKPIVARPVTNVERGWRWARRNPLLAGVSAALMLSLLAGGLGLALAYRRAEKALVQSQQAQARALETLHQSLLTQARAQLAAQGLGQHHDVLATLGKAAAIHPNEEVRSELVAALAKPDFRKQVSWRTYIPTLGVLIGFAPDLETYVGAHLARSGGCELRASGSGSLLRTYPHRAATKQAVRLRRSVFSRDGRHFAAAYDDNTCDIWNVDGQDPIRQFQAEYALANIEFAPDSRHCVGYSIQDGLCVWSLADGSKRPFLARAKEPRFLLFSPAGDRLAVLWKDSLEVLGYPDGRSLGSVPVKNPVRCLAWDPAGRRLAVAQTYLRDILVFDAESFELLARMVGHAHDAASLVFHPSGRWLLSNGGDTVLRLWDARSGRELLHVPVGARHALQFSTDGARFATSCGPNELGFFELTEPFGFREIASRNPAVTARVHNMDQSPSGRFLLTGGNDGLRIWDLKAAREVGEIRRPFFNAGYHVFFGPDDREIIYSRKGEGTFRRSFTWREGGEGGGAIVEFGSETATPVPPSTFLSSVGPDRRTWLSRDSAQGALLMPDGRLEGSRSVSRAPERVIMNLSADERWSAAVCNEDRRYLEVWDARNLVAATNMGDLYVFTAAFSPDSRWLVGASDKGHHVWETGTWRQAFFYPTAGQIPACISFSADGSLAALLQPEDAILLISLPDGRELVRLKPPMPLMLNGIAMSPDGNRLWLLGIGHRVYEWDLAAVQRKLASLAMDWGR